MYLILQWLWVVGCGLWVVGGRGSNTSIPSKDSRRFITFVLIPTSVFCRALFLQTSLFLTIYSKLELPTVLSFRFPENKAQRALLTYVLPGVSNQIFSEGFSSGLNLICLHEPFACIIFVIYHGPSPCFFIKTPKNI